MLKSKRSGLLQEALEILHSSCLGSKISMLRNLFPQVFCLIHCMRVLVGNGKEKAL
jgi:hypothetical protein